MIVMSILKYKQCTEQSTLRSVQINELRENTDRHFPNNITLYAHLKTDSWYILFCSACSVTVSLLMCFENNLSFTHRNQVICALNKYWNSYSEKRYLACCLLLECTGPLSVTNGKPKWPYQGPQGGLMSSCTPSGITGASFPHTSIPLIGLRSISQPLHWVPAAGLAAGPVSGWAPPLSGTGGPRGGHCGVSVDGGAPPDGLGTGSRYSC